MDNLPQRKNIRLKYYDYSEEGYYFITICTKNRQNLFGKIILIENDKKIVCVDDIDHKKTVGADDPVRPFFEETPSIEIAPNCKPKMKLSNIGIIIQKCWNDIERIYPEIECDEFVIMPNHIHGIININGRTESSAPTKDYARI